MGLLELSDEELEIVGQCLRAAADGPFFPEWEFETLIGLPRERVRELAMDWPAHREEATDAAISVLNNLIGHPHGAQGAWTSFIAVGPAEVAAILAKIIGRHRSTT